jgi:hypothetical protein
LLDLLQVELVDQRDGVDLLHLLDLMHLQHLLHLLHLLQVELVDRRDGVDQERKDRAKEIWSLVEVEIWSLVELKHGAAGDLCGQDFQKQDHGAEWKQVQTQKHQRHYCHHLRDRDRD